jgi:hypothetical protein
MTEPLTAREVVARATTEADFQTAVLAFGRGLPRPWLMYHTHRSDRSEAGFPDLVALRGPRMVVAELKALDRRTGKPKKVTPAQERWLRAFRAMRGPEVFVWTPLDWEEIKTTLA